MGSSQIEMDKETFEKFLKVDKKEKEYLEQVCEGVYKLRLI